MFFKDENAACILIYLICCKARNIQEQLKIHKRHEETALLTDEISFQKFEETRFYEQFNMAVSLRPDTDLRSVISLVN